MCSRISWPSGRWCSQSQIRRLQGSPIYLLRIQCHYFGVHDCLLSDRGKSVLSHLMQDVCQPVSLNTTAYHPQCHGMVERLNHTLKAMLRKICAKFGRRWDCVLPGVLWAYQNTSHESTKEKPSSQVESSASVTVSKEEFEQLLTVTKGIKSIVNCIPM